jgi:hypothetical protein
MMTSTKDIGMRKPKNTIRKVSVISDRTKYLLILLSFAIGVCVVVYFAPVIDGCGVAK